MQPNELRGRLHGVISFPVTPFKADLSLDLDGLRRNLRALMKHPLCAVVAAAGTGELYSLSPAEHLAVVKTVVEEVKGRVPVLAGAGDDMVPGYYAIGIRTYTSSIANVAPRLSLRLHELASAGYSEELGTLMNQLVIPLYALRAKRKGYEVSAMKGMMDMIGLAGGPVRPPLVDLRSVEIESLRGMVEA